MHSRVTFVQTFLRERKTVIKANGEIVSQAVPEPNTCGIQGRILNVTRMRILDMQMTVIEKCQELQLVNNAFNIENIR
jgi:hypothetical protein